MRNAKQVLVGMALTALAGFAHGAEREGIWTTRIACWAGNAADAPMGTVLGEDEALFCAPLTDTVVALDLATGAVRWTFTADAPIGVPPVYDGKAAVILADDGVVYRVENGSLVTKSISSESSSMATGA
jgi:outer membrane protein assembly factor BamB